MNSDLKITDSLNTDLKNPDTMFYQLGEGGRVPTKAEREAGWDLYAPGKVIIGSSEIVLVNTQFKAAIPSGNVGLLRTKSGGAIKGLEASEWYNVDNHKVLGGVIDETYRGWWGVILKNWSGAVIELEGAIAQFLILPLTQVKLELGELDQTERGDRGFGGQQMLK